MNNIIKLLVVLSFLVGFSLNSFSQEGIKTQDTTKSVKAAKEERVLTCSVSMHCNSCKNNIEKTISFEKGVKEISADLKEQKVTITYRADKTSAKKLVDKINSLSPKYKASIVSDEKK